MAIAVLPGEIVGDKDGHQSIESLRDEVHREHEAVQRIAIRGVRHAIKCGHALIKIRDRLPHGQFDTWREANTVIGESTAQKYMRIAEYQDVIRDEPTIELAINALGGLKARPTLKRGKWLNQARELEAVGKSDVEIASMLGVSKASVHYALNPDKYQQHKKRVNETKTRRKRAARALAREERDLAAKRAPAGVTMIWADLRKLMQAADEMCSTGDTNEIKAACKRVYSFLSEAEDAIGNVLDQV